MNGVDYYLTHSVHPSLWAGCRSAFLPSAGNSGDKIACAVGASSASIMRQVGGTTNAQYWSKNSTPMGGEQIVAQCLAGYSWRVPFQIANVRQASIACWIGARATEITGTTAATNNSKYIIAWWNGAFQTAYGIIHNSGNGAMWIDGAWRGSQTVWPQQLTHYCFTWGPGRLITVYQNGSVIHSHTMAGSVPSAATAATGVEIGNGYGGAGGAQWDDLRIYDRALSAREVRLLAQRPGVAYQISSRRVGLSITSGQTITPTGIASTLALGSPTVTTGAVDVSATGIASTVALGQPTVTTGAVDVSPTGIASTLALGEPTVTQGGVTISATGIASTLAIGEPTITVGDVSVSPTGIASTLAVGTPTVTSGLSVVPTGIASTLAIGQPAVTTGAVTVSATGIASALALGTPVITTGAVDITATGIASTLAIGTPTVTVTAPTIEVTGIASALALGQPTITTGAVTVSPTGISSTSALGQPSVIPAGAAQNITLTGIAATLGIGQPTVAIVVDTALVARSTTTLEEALYHYLTDPIAYTGHAEKPFKRVKTLDGITMRNRNDARSELQSRIGGRVYLDRRPADAGDAPAIVIQWTNGNHDYGLAGETDGTEGYLKLTVYAGGQDAARKGGTVYGLLQACLSGYNAGYWGDVLIGEATIDTGRSLAYSPRDASDQWTFTRDMNLIVYYYSASVPEYSDWPLTAIPSIEVMSTQLILSLGDSLIPQGDTLYNVVWLIQPTVGDPVITSFGGDPDKLVSTPGVSGCNRQAVVDRTVYTTIPDTPYITLILTDSSGGQHSKGVQVDG